MPNESGKGPQDGIAQFTLSEAKGLSTGMWETKPEGAGSPPTVLGTEERERRLKRVNRRQMVLRAVDVEKLIEPDHVARAFFCPKDLYHFRSSQPPLLPSPFTHFMPHYRTRALSESSRPSSPFVSQLQDAIYAPPAISWAKCTFKNEVNPRAAPSTD